MDKTIHDELHDFKKRSCESMTPEEQYQAVFQHLQMTHGPHSSLDVRGLTGQLGELTPVAIGWPKFLLSFSHLVTTLTDMKQTDPVSGAILRGPKPAPRHVPPRTLTGDPAQDGVILLDHYNSTLEEQAKVDREWPHGGPELNHKPPDQILKSILLGHVQSSPNTAMSKIYADSLEKPDWSYVDHHLRQDQDCLRQPQRRFAQRQRP